MNEKYYKCSTFFLIISGIIALSYFENQDAINLFSIVAAVVSIILGVYSLFTSESKNNETTAVFRKLELLNTKMDMKLDNLKDEVKSIKVLKGDSIKEDVFRPQDTIKEYIAHVTSEKEIKVDEEKFLAKLNEIFISYNSRIEIITASLLYDKSCIKSITVCVIIKGALNDESFQEIVSKALNERDVIVGNGTTVSTVNISMVITI